MLGPHSAASAGLSPEHRLGIDVADGAILLRRHPVGRPLVDARGALTLPAAARHLCGISGSDLIVLAAGISRNRLTVYPAAMVARILAAHHSQLADGPP
ncbi:hypothetical protein AB0H83_37365 [Dactylosporangium sp. NPDC050688]|uniref:hypothetical protein n=1 Tax=Dactylosporangium sp. NPDC050688 TaxID=3157217 RepID=UPI00340F759D